MFVFSFGKLASNMPLSIQKFRMKRFLTLRCYVEEFRFLDEIF
jgi:hypothetical protein